DFLAAPGPGPRGIEEPLDRGRRRRAQGLLQPPVRPHRDMDLPRAAGSADHPVHRKGVEELVGEEAADDRPLRLEIVLGRPPNLSRGEALETRTLARPERRAAFD